MEFVHLVLLGASLVAMVAGWIWISWRGGKQLNDRMTAQVSRSAALEKECSATLGYHTATGPLSTIR